MSPKRILVIDDADDVRRLLQRQLALLGYDTLGAENGEAGLASIERELPDLVLCDLRMPKVDGLTVLKTLKASHPSLPVVVVSGEGVFHDAIEALRLGAWDYLTKPVSGMAVLQHAVEKALEKAELIAENQRQKERVETLYRELADDQAAGRKLQLDLLPKDGTRVGRFSLTRLLLPSTSLSGDFFDVFALSADRWGFYLADVAGHGLPSALVTVMLRTLVERKLPELRAAKELAPHQLLAELNAALLAQGHEKHVSLFFGIVDERAKTLRYANAGAFPYPVMVKGTTELEAVSLESPGMPLGLMPDGEWEDHQLDCATMHRLVACTDGVFELLAQGTPAEKSERIRQSALAASSASGLIANLGLGEQSVRPDDVAVMVLERA